MKLQLPLSPTFVERQADRYYRIRGLIATRYREWRTGVSHGQALDILLDIAAHPDCMPTTEQIGYCNPSKDAEEIEARLDYLFRSNLAVRLQTAETEASDVDLVGLTESGVKYLEVVGVDLDGLRSDFEDLERTDRIRELESIERPPAVGYYRLYVPIQVSSRGRE